MAESPVPSDPKKPDGYQKLADLFGSYPKTAIFRRFGYLTMMNLMSLQAELVEIEYKLTRQQERDRAAADQLVKGYAKNFKTLRESSSQHAEQKALLASSLEKLNQYHSLLLQSSQVSQMGKPEEDDLNFLRKWLQGATEGNNFQTDPLELLKTWDEDMSRDLVALIPEDPDEGDFAKYFSPLFVNMYDYLFQWLRRPLDVESGTVYSYEDSKALYWLGRLMTVLFTMIASLLPALTVLWLYHVNETTTRIYITIGLTAAVGVFMKVLTNASLKEILGATVAFAAVEVVFIGSANGS